MTDSSGRKPARPPCEYSLVRLVGSTASDWLRGLSVTTAPHVQFLSAAAGGGGGGGGEEEEEKREREKW
ncbi:hypothetical protein EYF80_061857 [Liparis tanakae]|uniref:Uncharacterized protein n=1 Tax=Liparis tanakae TaxID=230148 RepID=A0A4Z2EGZ1_9TELE|nr:hypothetical protein EYF80_061857 [Liparis tanakae]